jgi:hypothetical protein
MRATIISLSELQITNTNYLCTGITGQNIPCDESGIEWQAERLDSQNQWWGYLQIPWKLIDGKAKNG